MWTDAPHVKLPKYGQETRYPCNQIKCPQKYGKRSPWTSSQTSQYLKDTIHYSWWWIVSAKPPLSIVTPCNKTITAEETANLYMENVWRRTGLPRQVISDRGPQFASKVMQEVWNTLNVKSTMSTAFHPQTDSETEHINQELEQYLQVSGNFQQDNWVKLIPFMEFAHNTRQHSATGKSPFEVWYGYQPEFIPPINFATNIPTVEECLHTLEQIRKEVTAALSIAAEVMKHSRPPHTTYTVKVGDKVWLEGTNVHTTHPKAKLAPQPHGPFKVIATWGVNCVEQLAILTRAG
jgi:hypothetical protein